MTPGNNSLIIAGYGRFICLIGVALRLILSNLNIKRNIDTTRTNEKQNLYIGNKATVFNLIAGSTAKSGRFLPNFTYCSANAITHYDPITTKYMTNTGILTIP